MKSRTIEKRKAYGMERMIAAIERAILSDTSAAQERAARWAAAWGLLSGIHTPGVRLRRSVLADQGRPERRSHPR